MKLNISQRIEPIGYDVKRNAYWLIGGNIKLLWFPIPPFIFIQLTDCGYNVLPATPRTSKENDFPPRSCLQPKRPVGRSGSAESSSRMSPPTRLVMFPTHHPERSSLLALEPLNLKQTRSLMRKPKLLPSFSAKMLSRLGPSVHHDGADPMTTQLHHPPDNLAVQEPAIGSEGPSLIPRKNGNQFQTSG